MVSQIDSARKTQERQIRVAELLISGAHSDFEIKTQQYTFKVHSAILYAQGGPYFQGLFDSAFEETQSRQLELDADPWCLVDVLFEIYTGFSCCEPIAPAFALLKAELWQMAEKVINPNSSDATALTEDYVREYVLTTELPDETYLPLKLLNIYCVAHSLMMSNIQSEVLKALLTTLHGAFSCGSRSGDVVDCLTKVYSTDTEGTDELRAEVAAVCFSERHREMFKQGTEARLLVMEGEPVAWAAMESLEGRKGRRK
jgi:hypothetical protein